MMVWYAVAYIVVASVVAIEAAIYLLFGRNR